MSTTFEHDSILGGFNLFKRHNNKFLLDKGERPPYPVMVSNPTIQDVLFNMNKADVGIILGFALIGLPVSRYSLRLLSAYQEYYRRSLYNLTYSSIIAWGGLIAVENSYFRLQGFVENGLQWKRKERKLKKYDFTTEFEDNSIWRHFRLRN